MENSVNILDLKPGDRVHIRRAMVDKDAALRFEEMGLFPGACLEILRLDSSKGPVQFKVRGTRFSLRMEEASLFEFERS